MKSPREVAHELCKAIVPACCPATDDGAWEHSRFCNAITAAIEARDAEHAAAFEALEEHVACVYASEADLRMELAEAVGADALAAAPEAVSACRQHIDCVAADMAHMNAFGELASHGSLLDQARRAIDAAAPAVVPAETPAAVKPAEWSHTNTPPSLAVGMRWQSPSGEVWDVVERRHTGSVLFRHAASGTTLLYSSVSDFLRGDWRYIGPAPAVTPVPEVAPAEPGRCEKCGNAEGRVVTSGGRRAFACDRAWCLHRTFAPATPPTPSAPPAPTEHIEYDSAGYPHKVRSAPSAPPREGMGPGERKP